MRYHLFLKYGWFPQNLGKEAVRTNMHTTVVGLLKSLKAIHCLISKFYLPVDFWLAMDHVEYNLPHFEPHRWTILQNTCKIKIKSITSV